MIDERKGDLASADITIRILNLKISGSPFRSRHSSEKRTVPSIGSFDGKYAGVA